MIAVPIDFSADRIQPLQSTQCVKQMTENTLNGLELATTGDDRHGLACRFIEEQYRQRFGCLLTRFMPATFNLYEDDCLKAVAGFRSAAHEPLFLEQYLDQPVEETLRAQTGWFDERQTIVEIGCLAAQDRAAAFTLMARLAPALLASGFVTAVATVNKPVRTCLARLGIVPVCLGVADPARVSHGATEWGTYYEGEPMVVAGDIGEGVRAIERLTGNTQP